LERNDQLRPNLGCQCVYPSERGHLRGDSLRDLEVWNFAVTLPKKEVAMNTVRNLFVLTGLATALWAQPNLFFNQGALVHVQANALLYVQGGYVNNDNAGNDGVTNNYGTIQLVNRPGGWRGNLTIGTGAEFNTYPGSWVYLQGDFSNSGAYRAGTGTYGGTIEFNGVDEQKYENTASATAWYLHRVRINNTATDILQRHVRITNNTATNKDMFIRDTLFLVSGRIHTGNNYEVRVLNPHPNAVQRVPWPPFQPPNFEDLPPTNRDRYIFGILRRNTSWNDGATYRFPVGGSPEEAIDGGKGIQGLEIETDGPIAYLRVYFDPTVQNSFTESPYCRAPDITNRTYTPLNNGRWAIQYASGVTGVSPSCNPLDEICNRIIAVRMYNRVVTNATTNGQCPSAGTPGDPFFGNLPSDLCYVGYNQHPTSGKLNPPNNCEGSNTGFNVRRTFNQVVPMGPNGTPYVATVYTSNTPLPSDELRLSAAPAGQAIRLTWNITHPEAEYILGYELYRKTENGTFTRIAQIDKQGRMQYTHDDAYVVPNTRYFYQVGQHDIFGNVRYSNIVEAMLPSREDAFSVQLQPNPITSEGSLLVNIPSEGMVAFTLYDASGKMVAQHSWTLAAGAHQLDLTPILAQVAAGNYNAHVTFGSEVKTLRLIKLDHTR
jgi:hypothetical protein